MIELHQCRGQINCLPIVPGSESKQMELHCRNAKSKNKINHVLIGEWLFLKDISVAQSFNTGSLLCLLLVRIHIVSAVENRDLLLGYDKLAQKILIE